MDMLVVTLASLFAGFIDSVVGGGGLVLVPALFATFPTAHPATLLGSNKGASFWGTGFATWRYSQKVPLQWRLLAPAAAIAFATSMAGAWLVTIISADFLRRLLPVVLVLVLLYTLAKKDLGHHHVPRFGGQHEQWAASGIGALMGLYDGFFGPGAGSFLVFLFVRLMGYDFLRATASAKVINLASNGAALLLFMVKGHVWWHYVVAMALANVAGSYLGTRLAIRHGTQFVRAVFLLVVAALILKTSWDAFVGGA
jgi:uncharacterized membrane protein YfcA